MSTISSTPVLPSAKGGIVSLKRAPMQSRGRGGGKFAGAAFSSAEVSLDTRTKVGAKRISKALEPASGDESDYDSIDGRKRRRSDDEGDSDAGSGRNLKRRRRFGGSDSDGESAGDGSDASSAERGDMCVEQGEGHESHGDFRRPQSTRDKRSYKQIAHAPPTRGLLDGAPASVAQLQNYAHGALSELQLEQAVAAQARGMNDSTTRGLRDNASIGAAYIGTAAAAQLRRSSLFS